MGSLSLGERRRMPCIYLVEGNTRVGTWYHGPGYLASRLVHRFSR